MQEYCLEELYYEYRIYVEREQSQKRKSEKELDKIEETRENDALAWAEEQERLEQEAMMAQQNENKVPEAVSVEDQKWMEEQLRLAKATYGEDFGEPVNEEF